MVKIAKFAVANPKETKFDQFLAQAVELQLSVRLCVLLEKPSARDSCFGRGGKGGQLSGKLTTAVSDSSREQWSRTTQRAWIRPIPRRARSRARDQGVLLMQLKEKSEQESRKPHRKDLAWDHPLLKGGVEFKQPAAVAVLVGCRERRSFKSSTPRATRIFAEFWSACSTISMLPGADFPFLAGLRDREDHSRCGVSVARWH